MTIEPQAANHEDLALVARLAAWSARHRKAVALVWLVVVIAAVGAGFVAPANTDVEQEAPGESGKAADLIAERFTEQESKVQEVVVFSSDSRSVDDGEYKTAVEDVMADLRGLRASSSKNIEGTQVTLNKRVVGSTLTHYDTRLPRESSPFVSTGGSGDVSFALVDLQGDFLEAQEHVEQVTDAVAEASDDDSDLSIVSGGDASVAKQSEDIILEDLSRALILNLVLTTIILVLVFRALVTAIVPLTLAFAAIITASGILAVISQAYALSDIYSEMVLLMGLATGIDYALFVISRYRDEKRGGRSAHVALIASFATSGKAVVFAGATVVLAICGMFLVGDATFTSLGLAAVVVVVLAVISSVTLLPALLALLGDNLDRLRVPFIGGSGESAHGGVWGWISDRVLARPAVWATVTLVVLLALAAPLLTLNLGFNGSKSLPEDVKAKEALLKLEESFTLGLTSPAFVVVDAGQGQNVFAPEVQSHVTQLTDLVEAETASAEQPDAPYGAPIQTRNNDAGDTQIVSVPINADIGEDRAIEAVNRLRDDILPAAFGDSPASAQVTGATAGNIDFKDNIIFRAPFVFAFVLGLAFIILLLTFRSIVVAVKALILNLLSVAATYGILVLVFQRGWLF